VDEAGDLALQDAAAVPHQRSASTRTSRNEFTDCAVFGKKRPLVKCGESAGTSWRSSSPPIGSETMPASARSAFASVSPVAPPSWAET